MKNQVDTIIFDFDGVIVDSGQDIADSINYMLGEIGRTALPYDQVILHVGKGSDYLVQKCLVTYDEAVFKKAIRIYKDYYMKNCVVKTYLYPNVQEILEHFREKNLAVVTNKPENITKEILKKLNIDGYFKIVIGPESVTNMKPHPESLLKVLKHTKTAAHRAVMIGDTYTDVEAGKGAGTLTCGVTYGIGATQPLKEAKPDFLLDDIGQLQLWIE